VEKAKKAAVISTSKLWEAATEINTVLEKYNLYLKMIHEGQDEGKVLLTQMLKDLPVWLTRILQSLNETGSIMAEVNGVRYEEVKPFASRYKMDSQNF